jgi:hypothetical protein
VEKGYHHVGVTPKLFLTTEFAECTEKSVNCEECLVKRRGVGLSVHQRQKLFPDTSLHARVFAEHFEFFVDAF